LRARARELGFSDREVARRTGLGERRYAFYVSGDREPDFTTLVRIAKVLGTTPNFLLGFSEDASDLLGFSEDAPDGSWRAGLMGRIGGAAQVLSDEDLQILAVLAEALVANRARSK
jgi:transcriptional regulator with XRE-family HTH domain